jgi:hypothetical protein
MRLDCVPDLTGLCPTRPATREGVHQSAYFFLDAIGDVVLHAEDALD